MANFGPDIAAEVVSHCQLAVGEIAQAFTSALDRPIEVTIGEAEAFTFAAVARDLAGPGLAVVLQVNKVGAALLLPQASGLLPEWYAAPDATGQSKLDTLAQELGMLLLPAAFVAERFQSLRVARLATSLRAAGGADGTGLVRLALKSAEQQGTGFLVWPFSDPDNFFRTTSTAAVAATADSGVADFDASEHDDDADDAAWSETAAGEQATHAAADYMSADSPASAGNSPQRTKHGSRGRSLRDLPVYTRSLLKIRVPLSVTLAEKRQAVGQILELGPGSIIQFEKSCEEMLDLNVSNLPIARGEAVKVGEKFGLRVTSLILPGERFKSVRPDAQVADRGSAAGR